MPKLKELKVVKPPEPEACAFSGKPKPKKGKGHKPKGSTTAQKPLKIPSCSPGKSKSTIPPGGYKGSDLPSMPSVALPPDAFAEHKLIKEFEASFLDAISSICGVSAKFDYGGYAIECVLSLGDGHVAFKIPLDIALDGKFASGSYSAEYAIAGFTSAFAELLEKAAAPVASAKAGELLKQLRDMIGGSS